MIRLLVRLAVVALLANAVYRVGIEYVSHLRFRDAIRGVAMFQASSISDLRARISDLAADYDIPLSASALAISQQNRTVIIEGAYTKPIELIPRLAYPWRFSLSMEVVAQTAMPAPASR